MQHADEKRQQLSRPAYPEKVMEDSTIYLELVVSTWPFRTGVLVYEPLGRLRIAEWDLLELSADPVIINQYGTVLNPLLPYRRRARTVLADLAADQELLRTALGITDESLHVEPELSDDVERELALWARKHNCHINDLALESLDPLLTKLEGWDPADHHAFVADWWENFERPASLQEPSELRTASGPGGALYTAMTPDRESALALWREEIDCPINEFSLYTALRCHWGWRLEFSDQPRPEFPVFERLRELFGRPPRPAGHF